MLKQMRAGASSTILKLVLFGLLLLAMTGLALMDVQGMFRRGVSGNTIASFGRNKLTAVEFDRMVQSRLREQGMKQSDAYRAGLPQQVLKQEIDSRLFNMASDSMGLQVDDVLAARQLKSILAPLVEKKMTEREALDRLLQAYHINESQLVATLKSQIASQQLLSMVTGGIHAPKQLVTDQLKYRNEWRRGEYFTLTAAEAGGVKEPSENELRSYYDSIAGEYALPEYRTLSVIVLDKSSMGDALKVSDAKMKQYYEDNIADYRSAETRVISQVVAADEEAAKKIQVAAEKNRDMQKAAEAAGKGKGTYIKAQSLTEGEMPVELSKTAFTATAGKVLPPVKSPLGWHVLYIEKVTPAITRPFKDVKVDIEKDLSQDKASEAMYERASKIDDEIGGGKTLAEVAKEYGLRKIALENIDSRGIGLSGKKPDAAIPLFDKVVETGFGLKQGAASTLIETPDGGFMIVAAEKVQPSEHQSFDKVRTEVLARWKAASQSKALAAKSAQIMGRLKAGESFAKIATEYRQPVQSTKLIKRGTPAEKAGIAGSLLSALFSLDKTGHTTAISGDASVTVVRLAERKTPSVKEFGKEEVTKMEATLTDALKQDFLEEYRTSLMDKYDVTINDKLLTEMYTPKDDGNGGEE